VGVNLPQNQAPNPNPEDGFISVLLTMVAQHRLGLRLVNTKDAIDPSNKSFGNYTYARMWNFRSTRNGISRTKFLESSSTIRLSSGSGEGSVYSGGTGGDIARPPLSRLSGLKLRVMADLRDEAVPCSV
jgi:hypothetical protein